MNFQQIYDEIKKDNIVARKNKLKEEVVITTELLSKLQLSKKEGMDSDIDAIRVVKKVKVEHIDSARFLLEADRCGSHELNMAKYCNKYLPKMITSPEEILKHVELAIDKNFQGIVTMKDMGSVMASIKSETGGAIDGKLLSTIVRERIQGVK